MTTLYQIKISYKLNNVKKAHSLGDNNDKMPVDAEKYKISIENPNYEKNTDPGKPACNMFAVKLQKLMQKLPNSRTAS